MRVSFFGGDGEPLFPKAKAARGGGLIEIVQERPAKAFPAHTRFLAAPGEDALLDGRVHQLGAAFAAGAKPAKSEIRKREGLAGMCRFP